jgi:hypothetical protein
MSLQSRVPRRTSTAANGPTWAASVASTWASTEGRNCDPPTTPFAEALAVGPVGAEVRLPAAPVAAPWLARLFLGGTAMMVSSDTVADKGWSSTATRACLKAAAVG